MSYNSFFDVWYDSNEFFSIPKSEVLFHVGPNVSVEENSFPSSANNSYENFQIFPNPTQAPVTIKYEVPVEGNVTLTIYNAAGQVVKKLINGERKIAGNYILSWDGKDEQGKVVSAGSYYYVLDVNNKTVAKKVIVLK